MLPAHWDCKLKARMCAAGAATTITSGARREITSLGESRIYPGTEPISEAMSRTWLIDCFRGAPDQDDGVSLATRPDSLNNKLQRKRTLAAKLIACPD